MNDKQKEILVEIDWGVDRLVLHIAELIVGKDNDWHATTAIGYTEYVAEKLKAFKETQG